MMTKGKIYRCIRISWCSAYTSKQKIQHLCWIFKFQLAEEDQLPSQLAQGMRLKIKSNPTAYIM